MSLVPSHVSPITSCTPPDPPLGWGPCSNFTKWRGVPRAQRVGAGSPPCPGCAPPQRRGSREGNKGSGHSWAPAAAAMATPPPATGHGPLGSPSPLPPPPTLASPPSPSPHPPPTLPPSICPPTARSPSVPCPAAPHPGQEEEEGGCPSVRQSLCSPPPPCPMALLGESGWAPQSGCCPHPAVAEQDGRPVQVPSPSRGGQAGRTPHSQHRPHPTGSILWWPSGMGAP